jgi:hypothetical protein
MNVVSCDWLDFVVVYVPYCESVLKGFVYALVDGWVCGSELVVAMENLVLE